jgi:hypothetical protein
MNASNSPHMRTIFALASFCANAPNGSQTLEVRHRGATSQETLLCFAFDKVQVLFQKNGGDAAEVAQHIFATSAAWAESAGAECFFVAQWLDEQRNALATSQWKTGATQDPAAPMAFNGSVDSLLSQQQHHIHALMSLFVDGYKNLERATKQVIEMQAARITELEAGQKRTATTSVEAETELAMQSLENERMGRVFDAGERILAALIAGRDGRNLDAAAQLLQAGRAAVQAAGSTVAGDAGNTAPGQAPPSLPASPTPAPTP